MILLLLLLDLVCKYFWSGLLWAVGGIFITFSAILCRLSQIFARFDEVKISGNMLPTADVGKWCLYSSFLSELTKLEGMEQNLWHMSLKCCPQWSQFDMLQGFKFWSLPSVGTFRVCRFTHSHSGCCSICQWICYWWACTMWALTLFLTHRTNTWSMRWSVFGLLSYGLG